MRDHPAGSAVIDLDRPAPDRAPGHGRRRRTTAAAVVTALVLGALLGGLGVYVLWYRPLAQAAERADAEVSVLLFADAGWTAVQVDDGRVRIETQVRVVNAGRTTVDVRAVTADQPGVTVRSPERERPVVPAATVPVDVVVEWDCAAAEPGALAASVTVETADEEIRTVTAVPVHGTPWLDERRDRCARRG